MNVIVCRLGVKGFFKLEAINKFSGKKRLLADWFENKVLDSGRNEIAQRGQWASDGSFCQVGTDATIPVAGDTSLFGYIAGTNVEQEHTFGAQATPPHFGWDRFTYRFPVGSTAANLSEAGVGWGASGATLFTRALIEDGAGNQITVTPLADEILDVSYELRYYPPLADSDGTILLDGVNYDTKTRASEVNNTTYWAENIGEQLGVENLLPNAFTAYDGDIGSITQSPSGLTDDIEGVPLAAAYLNNSFQLDIQASCGINGWLPTGDIRCVTCTLKGGRYQTRFTATDGPNIGGPVPKTNLQTMSLTWQLAWIEGTIP